MTRSGILVLVGSFDRLVLMARLAVIILVGSF